ncbi:ATP-binding protein [Simiduia sp. 21SJ11W-1]|uniref:ATP-binding protein n=1 Tax=Simiduia sp. 21SJ11W-1 TaxID=2909669 RepID=UPI00209CC464|nr:ATP-binding protein [Simiduia sp. 21SJ11W-1]UTA48667.1 ATP-binding protein [Simiduia sp. 21SJ11W-1]
MTFSLIEISLLCVGYLLLIFGIAWITENGWIPDRVIRHPLTYILSLGIFASAWSFYGVVDLAFQYGYGALAYYLGTGALFLFAPVAIRPLADLARRYQIHSLADLLVFRYHSNLLGALGTLCMFLGVLPLLALQIQAVSDTLRIITVDSLPAWGLGESGVTLKQVLAFMYCALLATFTSMFGSNREQHRGMITAMAFESLLKVCAICAVGLFAVFNVFDGVAGLDQWLLDHPENIALLHNPMKDSASSTLMLVFFATAVAMPHIFHMSVVENPMKHTTQTVSWAFPLFLLLMALPVFPILWAGFELGVPLPAQYFTLGVPIYGEAPTLTLIAFIGGLSAATGAMVVIALAMATMLLNHWLLPVLQLSYQTDIYARLMWLRRVLICVVFLSGFGLYLWFDSNFSLAQLALMAFIGTLQFLPSISAVAYWPKGNRLGATCGLALGASLWFMGLFMPSVLDISLYQLPSLGLALPVGINYWSEITLISLGANTLVFVLLSLLTSQGEDERFSADICADDELSQPLRLSLELRSAREFRARLAEVLGPQSARDEVARALGQLSLTIDERRPYALRRLRDQIEANLSGLMGIGIANDILDRCIPYAVSEQRHTADINLMESRLGQLQSHLTGMAAELNKLRLYHRQTLQLLPMAACSLGQDGEIMMWNDAMSRLTGIDAEAVTGSSLEDLADPWGSLIRSFAHSEDNHRYKQSVEINHRTHWISLHKALLEQTEVEDGLFDGQVILLEDVTETQLLEQELVHSERLASVGRLAAGVAHEIGNPITGIACLAQNLHYDSQEPEVHATADQILSQTDRVSRIVHSLVSFSHSGGGEERLVEPMNIHTCAQEAIALISLQKDKQQVIFTNHIEPDISLLGDSQRMIQVFVNLLSNARDASPEGAEVCLWSDEAEEHVVVSVEDEGSGIPPELMDRIMEPFFTTKEPGQGTGLGLAMVYSIVEDHKGSLSVTSPVDTEAGRGTRFDIRLPLA